MKTSLAKPFRFKQFAIHQDDCSMKVGTDGVLLGAWADVSGTRQALDIGAGSGVIAIMLTQRSPELRATGVEIDEPSFHQAVSNMQQSPWSNRLEAVHSAIQDFSFSAEGKYDLVISNPPFFSGGTFSLNQDRNSVRHTIKLPHGDLLLSVQRLLSEDGRFCVILPYIEGLRFVELTATYKLHCTRMTEVLPRPGKPVERLLLQFERTFSELRKDTLLIHSGEGDAFSPEYTALTGDFYLNM